MHPPQGLQRDDSTHSVSVDSANKKESDKNVFYKYIKMCIYTFLIVCVRKQLFAITRAIWQQAARATYQLLPPGCSVRATGKKTKQCLSRNKQYWIISRKRSGERENRQDNKIYRTRLKNKQKKEGRKKSNGSPEIPDRGVSSDMPSLRWGQVSRCPRETTVTERDYKDEGR